MGNYRYGGTNIVNVRETVPHLVGEEKFVYSMQVNAAVSVLSVPVNHEYWIFDAFISIALASGGTGTGAVWERTAGGTVNYGLGRHNGVIVGQVDFTFSFPFPHILTAGQDIRVTSNSADVSTQASFHYLDVNLGQVQ
jgi:hypothetical protein